MRNHGLPAICILVLLGTANAAADGGPVPDHYYLSGYQPRDWSGFYGGIQGGGLWGRFEFREFEADLLFPTSVRLTADSSSFVVGGVLGIAGQYRSWVFAGEMDVEFADFSGAVISPAGNRLSQEMNVFGSLRGRFGYALDRVLPYVTAGVALGKVDFEGSESGAFPDRISDSQTAFGFTVGAGVEFAFRENWSAGIEYRYTDLGEFLNGDEFKESNFGFAGSNRFSMVQARLIWRFGK